MSQASLAKAKTAKNDEFYTQYADIEREMNAYLDYDKDVFRDKTILLPCDDPAWSNFTKYFAQNFVRLGLKKLISTSCAPASKSVQIDADPSALEATIPQYDPAKSQTHGKVFTLTRDTNGDAAINSGDLEWVYLEGDGDFRSPEVTALRDEADIIITNPPFSLFREFLMWIVEANKKFVIIGNMNAIAYKQTFTLIRDGLLWVGATNFNTGMYFNVPVNFVYAESYKFDRERNGERVSRVPGVCWFTNLDHGRRHKPLALMTTAENLRFSRRKEIQGRESYERYDNYDAIEVPFAEAIPSDYGGVMGVPVSFLSKHSPEQFEIVGLAAGNIRGLAGIPTSTGKDGPYIDGRLRYNRIFIRNRRPAG